MFKLQIKYLIVFVIFSGLYHHALSQNLLADSSASSAEKNAINIYNTAFSDQLHLYNGKEYQDYTRPFVEGHPYFIQNEFSKGIVHYDGENYEDVSILYNLVTDEVIILDKNKIWKIQLLKEKVAGFSVSGHSFVNIPRDSLLSTDMTEGFYDVAVAGKVSLFVRRTKNIQTYVTRTIDLKVFAKDYYYLKKNGSYYSFHNKRSLLAQLGDKRRELQRYIRQNKLRFRKDRDNSIIRTVEYYNQLTK